MRIHFVVEDDQGETFRIEKKDDGYSLLYNTITDTLEESITHSELINRINFALSLGFHIEIQNLDKEGRKQFKNYKVNHVTPALFEQMLIVLESYYVAIRRANEEA